MKSFIFSLKNYGLYLALFIYGLFYHISSSEFWPISISKTWLTPEVFEHSMLQKPIFTIFLSLFHLIPLSDVQHLILVKALFCILGLIAIRLFINLILDISKVTHRAFYGNVLLISLVLFSATWMQNFFRVRSDQLSLLFFISFLYFSHTKKLYVSVLFLSLTVLAQIKGLIFLPAGLIFLYYNNKELFFKFNKATRYYLTMTLLGILIWTIALNTNSISYLIYSYQNENFYFPNEFLKLFLTSEAPLIIATLVISFMSIIKRDRLIFPYAVSSLVFFIFILVSPQSYPYYIASLSLPFYLTLLIYIMARINEKKHYILLAIQIATSLAAYSYYQNYHYNSTVPQLRYIQKSSEIASTYKLSYLDGMGTMPRQNLIPCFVSPNDDVANKFCTQQLIDKSSDILILTHRLYSLNRTYFENLNIDYDQILPGLWIKKSSNLSLKKELDINIVPALLIFNFN